MCKLRDSWHSLPVTVYGSQLSPGQTVLLGSSSGPPPPKEFFRNLLPQFEQIIYPFNPAVSPVDIFAAIDAMDESFEDAALVYAFGATTAFLTETSATMHGDAASQMNELLQYSLEAHRRVDLGPDSFIRLDETPLITNKRIMTCIYLEIAMMPLKFYDRSFGHLREAITMIQVVQTRQRSAETLRGADLIMFQRLYWEAYIHERFLTIASGFPSILPPLKSGVPMRDPIIAAHIQIGFDRIIELFTILDDVFLSNWDGREDRAMQITVDWIESKQVQLDQHEINAAESERELRFSGHDGFTELQHADLFITRLWIRTLLWQLALSKGFLRLAPAHTHEGLSLQFPALRLTTQLRSLVSRLDSIASISTQGSGILQKLFEITSTIADVLAVSVNQPSMESHIGDFLYIARFLINFERMRDKHRVYLQEKMDTLRGSYPGLPFSPVPLGALSQASSPMDQR
ncbi:hypothetical protein BN1723_015406 [Verticillium longisporum]|uniref:Transcription factor domain-containing protein n=1 Tax=Verticillium longisporum TaxID=100787 RepID=A0A0G4MWY0_VERLO|nr:hypothetical protein BN1723_015406 [Verticillium longisporum]